MENNLYTTFWQRIDNPAQVIFALSRHDYPNIFGGGGGGLQNTPCLFFAYLVHKKNQKIDWYVIYIEEEIRIE